MRDIFRSSGDFLVDLTPSWRNLGSNWEDLGLRFGSFWCPCIHIFELFEMYFSNEVDSKLLGVGGMGEAILDIRHRACAYGVPKFSP